MKKLLAVLALALLASPAYATIVGTKHDLSVGVGEELCVYCHTPHQAAAAVAPLWNRTLVNPVQSYTGTGTFSQNGLNDYVGTDVALCLSCHDGVQVMNAVLNAPSVGAPSTNTAITTASAIIGTNLTNDHPVGFNYAAADTADAEIQVPTAGFGSVGFPGVLAGAGATAKMQCSSCHDVHNNTNGAFLVLSNADSGLCLQCHLK